MKARTYVLSVSVSIMILSILSLVFMVGSAFGRRGLYDGPFP